MVAHKCSCAMFPQVLLQTNSLIHALFLSLSALCSNHNASLWSVPPPLRLLVAKWHTPRSFPPPLPNIHSLKYVLGQISRSLWCSVCIAASYVGGRGFNTRSGRWLSGESWDGTLKQDMNSSFYIFISLSVIVLQFDATWYKHRTIYSWESAVK
jgi:hypothetical protein